MICREYLDNFLLIFLADCLYTLKFRLSILNVDYFSLIMSR
jgi:hypothetical protein